MKKTLINQIQTEMSGVLNNAQRQKLCDVLEHCFFNVDIVALDSQAKNLQKPFNQVETEDLRVYLSEYQKRNNASKQTIDNIRRILSNFLHGLKMKITF